MGPVRLDFTHSHTPIQMVWGWFEEGRKMKCLFRQKQRQCVLGEQSYKAYIGSLSKLLTHRHLLAFVSCVFHLKVLVAQDGIIIPLLPLPSQVSISFWCCQFVLHLVQSRGIVLYCNWMMQYCLPSSGRFSSHFSLPSSKLLREMIAHIAQMKVTVCVCRKTSFQKIQLLSLLL